MIAVATSETTPDMVQKDIKMSRRGCFSHRPVMTKDTRHTRAPMHSSLVKKILDLLDYPRVIKALGRIAGNESRQERDR